MQDTVSTSTVMKRFFTEVVVRNTVCPVVCRANVPHNWTVCVSFTHESSRIIPPSMSLQRNHDKLHHQTMVKTKVTL